MKFNEYYINYSIIQYKKNIVGVKESATRLLNNLNSKKDSWLHMKVKNHIERTGIDSNITDVLAKIINCDLTASCFCKSTTKQNISEKCQLDYIEEYKGIKLTNLPKGGSKTWRFISGTGKFIQTPKEEGRTSHSFDFRYISNFDYFIMAKLTTTQGGGQNQQRQEMLDIIYDMKLHFINNPSSNKRFVILLDGDSYDGSGIFTFVEKAKSENRIFITNSDSFYAE
jgi:hypothetical protein